MPSAEAKEPGFHRRIVNTLLLLLLFRLLANIPLANVDEEKMHELLKNNPLLGAIDLFAGGEVLTGFSIVAVGLFPFLFATGLVRLAARLVPALRALEKDSEEERFKRYTTVVSVVLAFVLAWGLTRFLSLETGVFPGGLRWFTASGFLSTLLVVSVVTFGSWFTDKIKDWITKKGIGSGESVILLTGSSLAFANRLADLIYGGADTASLLRQTAVHAVVGLVVILLSIPLASAVRNIPMTLVRTGPQPPVLRGRPAYSPSLPLLLNRGGTTPVTSAIGFLLLFQIAATFLEWVLPGRLGPLRHGLLVLNDPEHSGYWIALAVLIVAFTYIANFTLLWKPHENSELTLAEYLRRQSGSVYITGLRPGAQTDQYLSEVMARITLPAAVTLAFLAAGLPWAILKFTGQDAAVAILSVVVFVKSLLGVRRSFDAYRILDQPYESLLKRGRIR